MTRQLIELESCSNPPRIQQVFNCKLKNFVLGLGFSEDEGMFCHFWRVYLALGANPMSNFLAQVFIGN